MTRLVLLTLLGAALLPSLARAADGGLPAADGGAAAPAVPVADAGAPRVPAADAGPAAAPVPAPATDAGPAAAPATDAGPAAAPATDAGPAAAPAVDAGAAAAPVAPPAPPPPPDPGAPSLAITVDKNEVQLGDVVKLTIKVRHRPETRIWLGTIGLAPFELLSRDELPEGDGKKGGKQATPARRRQRTFVLSVATYDPRATRIPGVPVSYLGPGGETRTITGPEIPMRVKRLLANEPDPKARGLHGPLPVFVPRDWQRFLYGLAAGVLVTLVSFLAYKLRQRQLARRPAPPPPPPRPADEVAFERLKELEASGLLAQERVKEFTFELSEIVRAYLGGRYDFDSLEMTTEELLRELKGRPVVGVTHAELSLFLANCDLVKFAKFDPGVAACLQSLGEARLLVERTRPPRSHAQVHGGGTHATA